MNAWKRMIAALLAASLFSACSPSAAGGTASQATAEETAAASAQPETEPAAALRGQGGMKVLLEMAKTRENFNYEAFFKAYAQNWSRINTYEAEQNNLNYDSHPLHYLRTNATVQQFEEFYTTFDVKEGDGMYLAPEDRIAVW